jgi:serine/threonine protein phosphatase PrpC
VNADAFAVDLNGKSLAFVVADGVGAMAGSQLASRLAATTAVDWIKRRTLVDVDSIGSMFESANSAVGDGLKSMKTSGATTMVMAAIAAGQAVVASVGDSEILAIDASGPARSLAPVDHLPSQPNVLLSWLDGVEEFEPHVVALPALPYRLCLVTDGVAGTLSYETIADLVRSVKPAEAARLLVREARANGSRDDATALVVSDRIEEDVAPSFLRRIRRFSALIPRK